MRKIVDWLIDYAHMTKASALMFWHREPPKHYLGHVVKGKIPIVILPGVFNRWAFSKPLADYISLLGHPVYIVPKLGNNISDIPSAANQVRVLINEQNIKELIIVAHSKGGLIGKYLLVRGNADKAVLGVVAVATPFSGTNIHKLVPHHSVKELSPESQVIQFLNSHKAINNKIISIIPEYDNHVWHDKGSLLEGALENIYVKNRGHHKLLSDKNVWEEVIKSVDKLDQLGIKP